MSAITFDTLRYAPRLRDAGVPAAEAEDYALAGVFASGLGDTAGRQDLDALRQALKTDLDALDLRMSEKLAEQKADTLKWLAGMLPGQAALAAALVKLL